MRTRWNQNRASFTLVELMVVIVILGILAGLITAAAMAALVSAREAVIKIEVDNLAMALNKYKSDYNEFPPDFTDTNLVDSHLRNRWPRIAASEITTIKGLPLTRAQALVFWLQGFSGSPTNPYTAAGQRAPEFNFDKTRLMDPTTGNTWVTGSSTVPVYISSSAGRSADGTLRPYIYFDSRTYSTSTYAAPTGAKRPYLSDANTTDVYAAPDTFQIIHAGLDEDYGQVNATSGQATYPSGTNYTTGDRDNIVNFIKVGRTLDDSIP